MTNPSSYIFLSENRQNTIKVVDRIGNYIQDLIPQNSNLVKEFVDRLDSYVS